jgi:hypothetical protein
VFFKRYLDLTNVSLFFQKKHLSVYITEIQNSQRTLGSDEQQNIYASPHKYGKINKRRNIFYNKEQGTLT